VEVAACTVTSCALHPFRLGSNPFRKKRTIAPEHLAALRLGKEGQASTKPSNRRAASV
jgi:hypothetical protein